MFKRKRLTSSVRCIGKNPQLVEFNTVGKLCIRKKVLRLSSPEKRLRSAKCSEKKPRLIEVDQQLISTHRSIIDIYIEVDDPMTDIDDE